MGYARILSARDQNKFHSWHDSLALAPVWGRMGLGNDGVGSAPRGEGGGTAALPNSPWKEGQEGGPGKTPNPLPLLSHSASSSLQLPPLSDSRGRGGAADGACFQDPLSQNTGHQPRKHKPAGCPLPARVGGQHLSSFQDIVHTQPPCPRKRPWELTREHQCLMPWPLSGPQRISRGWKEPNWRSWSLFSENA